MKGNAADIDGAKIERSAVRDAGNLLVRQKTVVLLVDLVESVRTHA